MAGDDREQQFERALARLLRDASPESHCPDAEILAAYHERTLPPEQMALWKEHISACAFCQEVLALVEKSEDVPVEEWQQQEELKGLAAYEAMAPAALQATAPEFAAQKTPEKAADTGAPEPTPIRAATSRTRWRWIVPVGALAAGAIAWVGMREINTQHKEEVLSVQTANNQKSISSLPMPPAERVRPQREKQESTAAPAPNSPEKAKKSVPSASGTPAQQTSRAQNFSPARPGSAAADALPQSVVNGNDSKVPAPSGSVVAGSVGARATRQMDKAAPAQAAPPPAQEPKPGGQTEAVEVQSTSPTVTVQAAPMTPDNALVETESRAAGNRNLVSVAATDHRLIVAPGMKHAWRVGDSGKIEYSSDRGKTWKPQRTGVTADLTAGSATSDKVCWVVGKNGTILLTTDGGKHWKSIASPVPGDLGGIHATDAQHASVWDVPNRNSFETADGGVTWIHSGNQ